MYLVDGIEIPSSDWGKTPAGVRELVEKMGQHIK
jgi:transposase